MKGLPIVFKGIINVFLFLFYVLVVSLAFSFIFPLVMQISGGEILEATNPIFAKIQMFIVLLVLVVSLIARKYFYISLLQELTVTPTKKTTAKKDDGLHIEIH